MHRVHKTTTKRRGKKHGKQLKRSGMDTRHGFETFRVASILGEREGEKEKNKPRYGQKRPFQFLIKERVVGRNRRHIILLRKNRPIYFQMIISLLVSFPSSYLHLSFGLTRLPCLLILSFANGNLNSYPKSILHNVVFPIIF